MMSRSSYRKCRAVLESVRIRGEGHGSPSVKCASNTTWAVQRWTREKLLNISKTNNSHPVCPGHQSFSSLKGHASVRHFSRLINYEPEGDMSPKVRTSQLTWKRILGATALLGQAVEFGDCCMASGSTNSKRKGTQMTLSIESVMPLPLRTSSRFSGRLDLKT